MDEPRLQPGIRAIGVTYDFAQKPEYGGLMLADQSTSGKTVNRMLHINRHSEDLLSKLEAVRLLCRESGCAQRYLTHDALNAIYQAIWQMAEDNGGAARALPRLFAPHSRRRFDAGRGDD